MHGCISGASISLSTSQQQPQRIAGYLRQRFQEVSEKLKSNIYIKTNTWFAQTERTIMANIRMVLVYAFPFVSVVYCVEYGFSANRNDEDIVLTSIWRRAREWRCRSAGITIDTMIPHIPASWTLRLISVINMLIKIGGTIAMHLHNVVVLICKFSFEVISPNTDELFSTNWFELGKDRKMNY